MKLTFTKPHKIGDFSSGYMGEAFCGYMMYRNVFIGYENVDFTISYNDFYEFYDIKLFDIVGNIGDPSSHIEEAIAVLREDGLDVEVSETFRWEGKAQVNGKRLWIKVQ